MTTENKTLHIALWVAQILLAAVFTLTGSLKTFWPPDALHAKLPDLAALPLPLVRFIGIAELAAAIGLVLPSATRIAPILTPLAASGVALVMAGALAFHVGTGHLAGLPAIVAIGAMACIVARERSTRARIVPRAARIDS